MAVVDFFAGCGGFSLGAHQAGFDVVAAFDVDPTLTSSFRRNFPRTKLVRRDLSEVSGAEIMSRAGGAIAGIIGGPPCQGFSSMGRRCLSDKRRTLLFHYFRLVSEIRPIFFVMENVRGLTDHSNRALLDACLNLVKNEYNVTEPMVLDAADFGAATARKRVFVVGVLKAERHMISEETFLTAKARNATVRKAIADLQFARELPTDDEFDCWKITLRGRPSEYARLLRSHDGTFTGNLRTMHTDKVVKRFAALSPGGFDEVGRYPRLAWDGLCPTLRAGTGSDKGSYQSVRPIHPEEDRVITVREAARLQGFPDCHLFHPTIWHSFRMIGNSVSPFVARHVLGIIAKELPWLLETAEAAE